MNHHIHYELKVRLIGNQKAFGPGVAELLFGIVETGSMQKAAEQMQLSYSKAWKMMKTAEQELGFALTTRNSGGCGGGGSTLTQEGKQILMQYQAFCKALDKHAQQIFPNYFSVEMRQ